MEPFILISTIFPVRGKASRSAADTQQPKVAERSRKKLKREEAIKHLELFLDDDPEDGISRDDANLVIGLSAFELEKWDKSIEYFSEVNRSESPYYV